MRAPEAIRGKIDLRTIDANVRIVGKSQADAVVERENDLAVRNVIHESRRPRQLRRGLRPSAEADGVLEGRTRLRVRGSNVEQSKKCRQNKNGYGSQWSTPIERAGSKENSIRNEWLPRDRAAPPSRPGTCRKSGPPRWKPGRPEEWN